MSPITVKNSYHVVIHAGSIALAVIAQVSTGIFFNLAQDSNVPNALFQTSSRNVSETFPLEVTLDWWSDCYWIIVDLWSMAWLLYAVVGLFKRNVLGPESCCPEIHPPVFYFMWTMINIARMCSMALWDRHCIHGAVILRWILLVLSFYMLYMSYSNLDKHKVWLAINNPFVISWTRYLTQNGLAVFAWWSLLNAVVGLGIVLKYKIDVPDPLISTVVLTIISLCAINWFILQIFLLTKYTRYTFSVYAMLILGLGAMFTRSYRVHDLATNTVYCDKSSKPVAMEPSVTFEGCENVWHTNLRSDDIKKDFCKI
uniref:uncharacterized protein LOC117264530 isoform X2 n=1 Tax=Epinephelus lanceolatus TaxID=310571 RepID=UPI001446A1E9|nr:uncharacterized protein LOC117264530 isoform X2 [Epinephelus lanceolatus]